jgi:hypothetical protein
MGSPGSREAILTAQQNIKRHLQHCDQHKSHEPGEGQTIRRRESISNAQGFLGGTRTTSPTWTHEINNGNTDLIVQFHDHFEFRGAVNAMIRLIDVHGIEKLQRVGVVGQGSGMNPSSIDVCPVD